MTSSVSAIPAASSDRATAHFGTAFEFETDCWDVHDAVSSGRQDFVLFDARSPDLYARGHVPQAINMPHRKIVEAKMRDWTPCSSSIAPARIATARTVPRTGWRSWGGPSS
jgi:3-mercaptopyruvate sulfurtransferase SseA